MSDIPLAVLTPPPSALEPTADDAAADMFQLNAFSKATQKAYTKDWRQFELWCAEGGRKPLPAEPSTVRAYIASLATSGKKVSTIERAMAAISKAHRIAKVLSPTVDEEVKATFKGIRNTFGVAPKKKSPITPRALEAAIEDMPTTLTGLRDRAILLLGFAGGFRRSEVVGLTVDRLGFEDEGLVIRLNKRKGNQAGETHYRGIPRGKKAALCPVRATRKWLDMAHITEGPVFRKVDKKGRVQLKALWPAHVMMVVKAAAARAGMSPKDFAAHSLRAGFITAAARGGKRTDAIMKHVDHQKFDTTAGYIRSVDLWTDNPAKGLY